MEPVTNTLMHLFRHGKNRVKRMVGQASEVFTVSPGPMSLVLQPSFWKIIFEKDNLFNQSFLGLFCKEIDQLKDMGKIPESLHNDFIYHQSIA